MKRLPFVVLLVVSACGPGVPAVVTRTDALSTDCSMSGTVGQANGLLDIAGAGTFVISLHVESLAAADPSHSHDFVEQGVAVKYTETALGGAKIDLQQETIGMFGVLAGGGTQDIAAQLIGPLAQQQLTSAVGVGEQITLTAHVQLKGHLEGSGSTIQTDPIDFPITVTNSGTLCPAGVAPTGPCGSGGGQDGSAIRCL
jgi:hypothetical protein